MWKHLEMKLYMSRSFHARSEVASEFLFEISLQLAKLWKWHSCEVDWFNSFRWDPRRIM